MPAKECKFHIVMIISKSDHAQKQVFQVVIWRKNVLYKVTVQKRQNIVKMEQRIVHDLQLGRVSRNALYIALSALYMVCYIFAMYKIHRTMPCSILYIVNMEQRIVRDAQCNSCFKSAEMQPSI